MIARAFPYGGGAAYASAAAFFASRLRATRPAAAAPKRMIIGGAGTGDGLPLLFPLLCPPFDDQPPRLDDQPPFELQPFDEEP